MILHKLSLVTNNNHTTNVIIGSNCILESLQSHSLSSKRVFIVTGRLVTFVISRTHDATNLG